MNTIAVIIINYNSSSFTINCLRSIWEKTSASLDYEIIVVDNNSEVVDFKCLEAFVQEINNKKIQLIRSKTNTGFGGGNMIGAQVARAHYLAFVNNDSIFNNDCLSLLHQAMTLNESYGVCGPTAYDREGKVLPTLDHFTSLSKEIFGRKWLEKLNPSKYPNRKKIYTSHQKGQFVSGSFMMVRATDFWEIGGFDTNIFLYHEETDLCKRMNLINKYAYCIPEAAFTHYHGASTPKSALIKTELKLSQLYVVRKHEGYLKYKILLGYFQIRYLLISIFKPKYWGLCSILWKGAHLSESIKNKP